MRIEYPGAWYHVMNRGAGRKGIFLSDRDRHSFILLLKEISETFHMEIHAYSLMGNHYHLLIRTPEGGLGRALRHLNGVYTMRFNRRHKTDGPLFRGRYKARLVDSEEYLLQLVRYIHLNPVKAGMCENPAKHRWTSHGFYLRGKVDGHFLITEEVLSRFERGGDKSRRSFHEYVCAGVPKQFSEELEKQRFIIGGKPFQEWVYENFGGKSLKAREVPEREKRPRWIQSVKGIMDCVAFAHGVEVAALRKRTDRKKNDARSMAIYLARKLTGIPQRDLARWMNATNEYAVAKVIQRFGKRYQEDKKLRRLTAAIEKAIWSNVKT